MIHPLPLSSFWTGAVVYLWLSIVAVSDTISGPELKTTLTGLGLTPKWFAGHLNISMRTVVRWLDQDRIPDYAAKELTRVQGITRTEMIEVLTRGFASGVLTTFRRNSDITPDHAPSEYSLPASWHRALTYRAVEQLRDSGRRDVTVDYWT